MFHDAVMPTALLGLKHLNDLVTEFRLDVVRHLKLPHRKPLTRLPHPLREQFDAGQRPRTVNDVRMFQAHPNGPVVGAAHRRQIAGDGSVLTPAGFDENLRPHGTRQGFRAAENLEGLQALVGCHCVEAMQDWLDLPGADGRPIEVRERRGVCEEPL